MKLGIIKELKFPVDKRVPLTPAHCLEVLEKYSNVEIFVQKSEIRSFKDKEYEQSGITLVDDISHCDILMGVKEVPENALIPSKKYMFFSHTFKGQTYNRSLLQTIIAKCIQLIDYETLTNKKGHRIIGFGRYAGIVGCYNGLRALGMKKELYDLKLANQCHDYVELKQELKKVQLPSSTKIVSTGFGRVGNGAAEIFNSLGLREVFAEDLLNQEFNEPVYTRLGVEEYYATVDGSDFDRKDFFKSGEGYISTFPRYLEVADLFVACHYWDASSPYIVDREALKNPAIKVSVIADISCDINGPIASTLRASSIGNPLYGYDPKDESETEFMADGSIGVMAVDNLPCELPRDASEGFGRDLIDHVFPFLLGGEDPDRIIERASETSLEGELMPKYAYLGSYLLGKD
ncbi:alanine dehydrogenase [Crocinitomix catalasitica]|nr:alanine dehydrogenase [Crocinitomix catalasitica]